MQQKQPQASARHQDAGSGPEMVVALALGSSRNVTEDAVKCQYNLCSWNVRWACQLTGPCCHAAEAAAIIWAPAGGQA